MGITATLMSDLVSSLEKLAISAAVLIYCLRLYRGKIAAERGVGVGVVSGAMNGFEVGTNRCLWCHLVFDIC